MTTLDDYIPDPLTLLTAGDLKAMTGQSLHELLRLAEEGEVPAPFYVGRRPFWLETDIVDWLRKKRNNYAEAAA
jgi:predicted DNA-binding transcriptional regulator AlpA